MDCVISLFDFSGIAVKDWVDNGYCAIIVDKRHNLSENTFRREGNLIKVNTTLPNFDIIDTVLNVYGLKPVFLSSFPPCTDLAVSGARHFEKKRRANPRFQQIAMENVYFCRDIGVKYKIPFYIENPVSVISTMWRKPDYIFHPYEYYGYLNTDNYTKKTCLWTGNGFVMPEKKPGKNPDKNYILYLGSRRSTQGVLTPRGFAKAVYLSNKDNV